MKKFVLPVVQGAIIAIVTYEILYALGMCTRVLPFIVAGITGLICAISYSVELIRHPEEESC